jgi:hypothetical protein
MVHERPTFYRHGMLSGSVTGCSDMNNVRENDEALPKFALSPDINSP